MVSEQGHLPEDLGKMGPSGGRLVRLQKECAGGMLLLPKPGRQTLGNRCPIDTLELEPGLRLPPNTSSSQGHPETPRGTNYSDLNSPFVAEEELVLHSKTAIAGGSMGNPFPERCSSPGPSTSSRPRDIQTVSLDPESETLRNRGLSEKVISTLRASRKNVTSAIYLKIWKRYCSWLGVERPDTSSPPINRILDFLQCGLELGLRPSTLKVQVSALSSFYDCSLASHRWIRRFFRAVSRLRPSLKSRAPTWDLNIVLEGLTKPPFVPLSEISLKHLSLKTALERSRPFLVGNPTSRSPKITSV
ncbi:uncharacterized protein LOC120989032 [Bufo bufo]|uniref:uncharacterized protein LOC120987165 n=1 Tax=Bufo bufo TaxID=8384 RepID=UPI001ABDA0EC|nr:uncharacterized protein LOC120987165 [Bufo bufo]XP_040272812.1 uncharacterized protein LOC120989032 [Bufo bufo]